MEVDHEPAKMMLSRAERTRRFWAFLKTFENEHEKLSLSEERERNSANIVLSPRESLLASFSQFAREVGIDVNGRNVDEESSGDQQALNCNALTVSREQEQWEFSFIELSRQLNITIRFADHLESEELAERTCFRNHRDKGFEGQLVYVWYGFHKGKLGTVAQMNNGRCRVKLEATVLNAGIIIIEGQYLIA